MKKMAVVLSLVFLLVCPVYAKTIFLDSQHISFEAPDAFEPLSEEIISIKYPAARAPKNVIGNKSAATTIAYDIKPQKLPPEEIERAQSAFTQMFPRMIPHLQWIDNKIIELAGRKWVYMEMTSSAIDTDIHNIMLFTGYNGQMLVFNFNSTKEEFAKYEKALRESIQTISIQ